MDVEIVPKKLLIIAIVVSICILFYIFIQNYFKQGTFLSVCNTDSKVNVLIQSGSFDVLIRPIGKKETLDCLGKHISFYDRNIEIIVSGQSDVLTEVQKRYSVGRVVTVSHLQIGTIELRINENITILSDFGSIIVYQREIGSVDHNILYGKNSTIIRPKSKEETSIESMISYDTPIEEDEHHKIEISRLRIQ